jgi:hypothetical protein
MWSSLINLNEEANVNVLDPKMQIHHHKKAIVIHRSYQTIATPLIVKNILILRTVRINIHAHILQNMPSPSAQ